MIDRDRFVWKYIDGIDPEEISRVQKIVLDNIPRNSNFFQNLHFVDIDTFMGKKVQTVVLLQLEPRKNSIIHIDDRVNGNVLALNIPLENCEDSYTDIWKSSVPPEIRYTTNRVPYNFINKTKCTLIDRFTLTNPVLFRTDLPHSGNNSANNKFRRAVSIRFEEDPWELIDI